MRKRASFIFTIITLAVVMLTAFFAISSINASTPEVNPSLDFPAINTIQGASQYYLPSPPIYPNNSYKITSVFLEKSACYVYSDASSVADIDFTVPDSMFLYIVNGTIRNDYSAAEILKLSNEGVSQCTIGIDIYLYDAQGNFINTLNRGNTLRGCSELSLRSKETADFKTVFVTSIQNVAYFEVYVSFLKPLPLF